MAFFYYAFKGLIIPFISIILVLKCLNFLYPQACSRKSSCKCERWSTHADTGWYGTDQSNKSTTITKIVCSYTGAYAPEHMSAPYLCSYYSCELHECC